jgi:hypothetical protein
MKRIGVALEVMEYQNAKMTPFIGRKCYASFLLASSRPSSQAIFLHVFVLFIFVNLLSILRGRFARLWLWTAGRAIEICGIQDKCHANKELSGNLLIYALLQVSWRTYIRSNLKVE